MSDDEATEFAARIPANGAVSRLLRDLLPGEPRRGLRRAIRSFCANPLARCIHIKGPIGGGKTTTARVIALAKSIAPLRQPEAERILSKLRFERPGVIDQREMPWYVELNLTGLVETIADSQLFGVAGGVFTGVPKGRPGVFEQAASARGMDVMEAQLTGGVVFLDELLDLSLPLQAKLLTVLAGGPFYRVGAEDEDPRTFRGITVTASWRALTPTRIRPDLLSRIGDYIIEVPPLAREGQDFSDILHTVHQHMVRAFADRIDEMARSGPTDRAHWAERRKNAENLPADLIGELAKVDWSKHGNMRALAQTLERILVGGEDPARVIATLPLVSPDEHESPGSAGGLILSALLSREGAKGTTLSAHIKDTRRDFLSLLLDDGKALQELAEHLGLDPAELAGQARKLQRNRSQQGSDND